MTLPPITQKHPLPSFFILVTASCSTLLRPTHFRACRSESCDHRRIRTHCQSDKTKRGADSGYWICPTPGWSSDPPWQPSIAL